jgi:hypothetical protein
MRHIVDGYCPVVEWGASKLPNDPLEQTALLVMAYAFFVAAMMLWTLL